MSLPEGVREQVRQRAAFACEFCGVTETDAGGLLTVDHFHLVAQDGAGALENLLYCCPRCNLYKAGYWPGNRAKTGLWNPRKAQASNHFLEMLDGMLHALTPEGAFTLRRLRLNRPPLVAHRLRKRMRAEGARLLIRFRDLAEALENLRRQEAALLQEQQRLLEEQRALLRRLLGDEQR